MTHDIAPRRAWVGLAVLALPTLLVAMDITALFMALPQISEDLGASGTEQLWITDGHGFLMAGFVITMGTIGDRIGRRGPLMAGGAAFAVLSVVGAYSVNPQMLIAVRALLVAMAGTGLMATQYLQGVLGHSPLASAVLFALGIGLVLGSVPPERAGAAAMSETSNYFGGSLGMATLGVVGAAVYRSRMADAGAPAAARDARGRGRGRPRPAGCAGRRAAAHRPRRVHQRAEHHRSRRRRDLRRARGAGLRDASRRAEPVAEGAAGRDGRLSDHAKA